MTKFKKQNEDKLRGEKQEIKGIRGEIKEMFLSHPPGNERLGTHEIYKTVVRSHLYLHTVTTTLPFLLSKEISILQLVGMSRLRLPAERSQSRTTQNKRSGR